LSSDDVLERSEPFAILHPSFTGATGCPWISRVNRSRSRRPPPRNLTPGKPNQCQCDIFQPKNPQNHRLPPSENSLFSVREVGTIGRCLGAPNPFFALTRSWEVFPCAGSVPAFNWKDDRLKPGCRKRQLTEDHVSSLWQAFFPLFPVRLFFDVPGCWRPPLIGWHALILVPS